MVAKALVSMIFFVLIGSCYGLMGMEHSSGDLFTHIENANLNGIKELVRNGAITNVDVLVAASEKVQEKLTLLRQQQSDVTNGSAQWNEFEAKIATCEKILTYLNNIGFKTFSLGHNPVVPVQSQSASEQTQSSAAADTNSTPSLAMAEPSTTVSVTFSSDVQTVTTAAVTISSDSASAATVEASSSEQDTSLLSVVRSVLDEALKAVEESEHSETSNAQVTQTATSAPTTNPSTSAAVVPTEEPMLASQSSRSANSPVMASAVTSDSPSQSNAFQNHVVQSETTVSRRTCPHCLLALWYSILMLFVPDRCG